MTKAGYTCHDLDRNAHNRDRWRTIVSGLAMLFKRVDRQKKKGMGDGGVMH
mgnify:CR=1 FL=1